MKPITKETFRPVIGWEGVYEVGDLGSVRRACSRTSGKAGHLLSPQPTRYGYLCVHLYRPGRKVFVVNVHCLVAAAFIGPRPKNLDINHKDGNKRNPALVNLEYVTRAENMQHAVRIGLKVGRTRGLTDKEVLYIRSSTERGYVLAVELGVAKSVVSEARRGVGAYAST